MIRKWDIKSKEVNDACVNEIITRIQEADDLDSIGIIAAQDIIDIVLEHAAPEIYNAALNDATKVVTEKVQDIEYGIEELKSV